MVLEAIAERRGGSTPSRTTRYEYLQVRAAGPQGASKTTVLGSIPSEPACEVIMHDNALRMVSEFRDKYIKPGDKILDVGSLNVNGCHRGLLPDFDYTGIDVQAGPNVDVVVKPYDYPFPANSFDIVLSGQCIEHSQHPWRILYEIGRLVKVGGFVLITAPWQWQVHRYPVDCFRILPDGLVSMLTDAGLKVIVCDISDRDTYGIATK